MSDRAAFEEGTAGRDDRRNVRLGQSEVNADDSELFPEADGRSNQV